MIESLFHTRRLLISHLLESAVRAAAWRMKRRSRREPPEAAQVANPETPEDFRPLHNACFQNPYAFYKMLRDTHPVYQLPNGIYCISRFEDILAVSRDTARFSSTHQGAIAGLRPGQSIIKEGERLEKLGALGLIPSNVLALSDPPKHTGERKMGHKALNARFVDSLDDTIESLVRSMMDAFIERGEVEFMDAFGWKLPMKLIIQLLGFPAADFERIKAWCVHGIRTQSGVATAAELMTSRAENLVFFRYCWQQYLIAKKNPRDDLSAIFVAAASDPDNPMTDQIAVSAIFQLLIAGSDSSATSMGNALKLLIENPGVAQQLKNDISLLPTFIEEVFRLEAAFQGHYRWVTEDSELQGVKLPRGSRLFLMWASGNRDERVFEFPDVIDLARPNGKKHLTFGHGIHACIGRELARSEIRIVLREFLQRTENLRFNGPHPFIASMFARTLVALPISFDQVTEAAASQSRAGSA